MLVSSFGLFSAPVRLSRADTGSDKADLAVLVSLSLASNSMLCLRFLTLSIENVSLPDFDRSRNLVPGLKVTQADDDNLPTDEVEVLG